jgi:hypothetical protein
MVRNVASLVPAIHAFTVCEPSGEVVTTARG